MSPLPHTKEEVWSTNETREVTLQFAENMRLSFAATTLAQLLPWMGQRRGSTPEIMILADGNLDFA